MKKRLLVFFMIAAMVLSLAACSGKEKAPVETYKVGLVTDLGGVEDQSFNQSAWEGLQRAEEDFGVEVNFLSSSTDADYAPNIETFVDEEYDLIKIHPVTGYHILKDISDHYDMATAAKYHHERYDGKGYPNGLLGENIPEMARILAVADSYDAMTSNRSYRKGLPQSVVRSEIEKGKGTQFDPDIADIMLQIIDEDKEYTLRQIERSEYKILIVGEDLECNQRVKDILQKESIY